ncbi:MAG TPA: hypothetical protein VFV68_11430 [Agriterribacter sp.]|nr:hypothetical protein [Agriterribacter sp.]
MKIKSVVLAFSMVSFSPGIFAQADVQETIGMIKKNLTESKEKIKHYEWIETTTTSLKGEDKSVKQNQCYYSVDGKLTKVATGATTEPAKTPGGLRGKVVANKKEDMAEYIKACVAKIQTYLPPDGAKLQQIYAGGKATIQVLEPGKKFKLSFPDYNVKGDMLSISVDKANQKIMAVDVNTYIDDAAQKVVFNVTYSDLPDGTQYQNTTTLDAQAKELKIVIANSGYKKAGK